MYRVTSSIGGRMLTIKEYTDDIQNQMVRVACVRADLAMCAPELQAEVERLREALEAVYDGMTDEGIIPGPVFAKVMMALGRATTTDDHADDYLGGVW